MAKKKPKTKKQKQTIHITYADLDRGDYKFFEIKEERKVNHYAVPYHDFRLLTSSEEEDEDKILDLVFRLYANSKYRQGTRITDKEKLAELTEKFLEQERARNVRIWSRIKRR